MKNFLDLLATDLHLDLRVEVEPVGSPDVEIRINQQLVHQGLLLESIQISKQLPLLSGFIISVKLKNKIYELDSKSAIVLNKISIDRFDIVPNFTHLAQYVNDHNSTDPTSYIGFNGEWKFEVPRPFYQWQHQVTGQGWLFSPCSITDIL